MAQNNWKLLSPDIATMSPLRLADIGTPSAEAGMPSLRLSDIMTPYDEARGLDQDGTPVDSGHEASAPTTATAGWELRVPDPRSGADSEETAGRLRQDVCRLDKENRLLRQKLRLLQKNSNLKQVALIGTVISWFADKGLMENDTDTAYRLTSMMLSARATDERAEVPSVAEPNHNQDNVQTKEQTTNSTSTYPVKAEDECPEAPRPDNGNDICVDNDDTSEWPSQSLDISGSFDPPFSSSKKEMKTSVRSREDETLPAEDASRQPTEPQAVLAFHVGSQGTNQVDAKTDPFDESAKRLDARIRRVENAVNDFGGRHAQTRDDMTQMRQNAVKRFRVWKAISASRRSAVDEDGEAACEYLKEQSIIPTPLTQYPLDSSAEEAGGKTVMGRNRNQTILGEIAFQVERRILAFVFQRKEILYGYNLGNLDIMIRTHLDPSSRPALQRRYDLLMEVLRGYGWLRGRHPQFVAEVIVRHGTLQDVATAQAEAMKRGWRTPSELKRGVLCLCPIAEVLDMLVILDCLLHMARNDGQPVFLW